MHEHVPYTTRMALVADSGPVTSAAVTLVSCLMLFFSPGSAQSGVPPCKVLAALQHPDLLWPHTGLHAVDRLIGSLGLVTLGHDGRDPVPPSSAHAHQAKGRWKG